MTFKNSWTFFRRCSAFFCTAPIGICLAQGVDTYCQVRIPLCNTWQCEATQVQEVSLTIDDECPGEYDRALQFTVGGVAWLDVDGDCENTRDEALALFSAIPTLRSANGCHVTSGLWIDPFSDAVIEVAEELHIDHIVPLKEAYESGAHTWSQERRLRYANDLEVSGVLMPMSASMNISKGASEPYAWQAPSDDARCRLAERWLFIKWWWQLTVDQLECLELVSMIDACDAQRAPD